MRTTLAVCLSLLLVACASTDSVEDTSGAEKLNLSKPSIEVSQISGVGDVTSDPLLVNAGGWNATDYKLTSTSPLKTAGTTESAVTADHFGTARSASYSIGAHEY